MPKAFLDTTVLVDATLKQPAKRAEMLAKIARFDERLMPVYAIKEFKAGPLMYFRWLHNKLAASSKFADVIASVQALSRGPQRYRTSTALEALEGALRDFGGMTPPELHARYGPLASTDAMLLDLVRTSVLGSVFSAWKARRSIATSVVHDMACYSEAAPQMKRGRIELDPTGCDKGAPCGLAERIKADPALLERLHETAKAQATPAEKADKDGKVQKVAPKRENVKRAAVLNDLTRKPREPLPHDACRALGDAVFVILAPPDSTIVTTNLGDYEPLAAAAGKKVERP